MILLDTDHLSLLQARETPAAFALQTRLEAFPPDEVATTVVTLEEQMRGWLGLIHRITEVPQQVRYYERLLDLVAFFAVWEVLPFDQPAATTFVRLRQQRVRIGTMDLKIAAVALEHKALCYQAIFAIFSKFPVFRSKTGAHDVVLGPQASGAGLAHLYRGASHEDTRVAMAPARERHNVPRVDESYARQFKV